MSGLIGKYSIYLLGGEEQGYRASCSLLQQGHRKALLPSIFSINEMVEILTFSMIGVLVKVLQIINFFVRLRLPNNP